MQLSNHSELIAVLTELWELLDTLVIVKPGTSLRLPPPDTGFHRADNFSTDAALAAGFTLGAVTVMSTLPYLHGIHFDMDQRAVEICGSTFPLSYLDFDEEQFEGQREIFANPENLISPSAFRLTWQDVNGWEYIYDTEKRLVYVWNPMNDEVDAYFDLRPVSPRQAFQPLLDKFRGLRHLVAPEHGQVDTGQDASPQRWQFGTEAQFRAEIKVWEAMCGLADIYLECGWNANAVVQTAFRSIEFTEKRSKYMSEVFKPLKEEAYREREFNNQHPELCNWMRP